MALSPFVALGSAVATVPEICGDGVDNDGSGGDASCGGRDADRDGYFIDGNGPNPGIDCDDTDRNVYPEIWVDAGSGNVKLCNSSGSYGSEVALSSITCSSGSGSTYWMATTGSNSNAGSYASPWRDYLGFVDSSTGGYHAPVAGDCFIFKDTGSYTGTFTSGSLRQLYLNNKDGTSTDKIRIMGAPGVTATIENQGTSGTPLSPINLNDSNYIILENITVSGGFSNGTVSIAGGTNVEIRNIQVFDSDGDHSSNPSCLRINDGSDNANIHHNLFYDCYDATPDGDQQNNALIRGFNLVGVKINDNVAYFDSALSTSVRGPCLVQKHGLDSGSFEAKRNVFAGCNIYGMGSDGANTVFEGNIIANATGLDYAFRFIDFGAPAPSFAGTNEITNNTVYHAKLLDTGLSGDSGTTGTFTISGNVVYDNSSSYSAGGDDALIRLDHYSDNASYTDIVGGSKLTFANNCYYNTASQTPRFSLWGDNDGPGESFGAVYTGLAAWQGGAISSNDTNSYVEDPAFDADLVADSTNCVSRGAFYSGSLTPSAASAAGRRSFFSRRQL